ncbi:MAG: hypothetical protein ACD_3C00059G0002 [uncultured bacterium (gcode 4)]|uniref:Uncharacterized protein n=1 Tax=uncultured bacterium (gcode 4) TaxID=1234023 RepID=K2GDT3_9BACT|nr:MAG: hypothetical protein ACD_3C00059G0002 [uncultured bacterium (gcode 4)]
MPTPTLFWLNANWTWNVVYDNTFWSGKDILPWVNNVAIFDSSKVYSTWSDNLWITDITDLMTTIKAAYLTWNVTTPAVQTIVNASWAGLIDIWNWLVKNSLGLGSAEINSSVSETIDIKIVWDDTSWRNWSNWTYASNCNWYKNPPTGKSYTWSTWNWQYWIKPWAVAIKVICEMTTSSWWWTKVNNLSDTEVNLILGWSWKQLVKCSDTWSEYILSPNLSWYTWSSSIKTKVWWTWNISWTDQSCGTDSEFDAASFWWWFWCSNWGWTENKFYPWMCEAGWPWNCWKWQWHTNSTFNICWSGNYASYSVFVR